MLARVGTLETSNGVFETPILFPVHNAGSRNDGNSPEYWKEIPEMKTMMLNAHFIKNDSIYQRLLKKGLHNYFKMDGLFFVDSGGLQSRVYNFEINPIEILRVQEDIGTNIASTLDIPILPEDSITQNQHAEYIKKSVENALNCLKNKEREDMKLYAAIHGNNIKVLLNTIDYLNKRGDFDGFAVGGLVAKRSNFRQLVDTVLAVRKHVGEKQLHVFGLGGPSIIPLLTYLGVDSFDSSSFLTAGSNRIYYMPEKGSIKFKEMQGVSMLPCVCPVCSKNSFDDVRSQRKLIALHNLWTITYELRRLKLGIMEGNLEPYLEKRFEYNPLIKNAYKYAKTRMRGFA
ncbi:tRNA-guanine transglycosylase [Methanosarcina sp. Mfa9]|uniref:tRNA-guanine transglycosylase n=1 Tax=Methanosarcina sp. Mfa9 TaxID=3439063 RepID=UPI003F857A4D